MNPGRCAEKDFYVPRSKDSDSSSQGWYQKDMAGAVIASAWSEQSFQGEKEERLGTTISKNAKCFPTTGVFKKRHLFSNHV